LQQRPTGKVLQQFAANGKLVAVHELPERTIVFGRSGPRGNPDLVLANEDTTLSRFHGSITRQGSTVLVEDFNSRNGTYLKVGDSVPLEHGDEIRIGQQVLRLVLRADAPEKQSSHPSRPFLIPVVSAPAAAVPAAAVPSAAVPSAAVPPAHVPVVHDPSASGTLVAQVTFMGAGGTFAVEPAQTILDVADDHDVDLDHECWVGKCGADLIRIVEGHEYLNEVSEQESRTIKRRGAIPGECRLACMTKVRGPVVVVAEK
jgi:ferredoxin